MLDYSGLDGFKFAVVASLKARRIDAIVEGRIPVDPDWPAPTNRGEIFQLMNRLPHRQQVIAAVTAAEMVLIIFESRFPIDDVDFSPREAIELARRWVEGDDSITIQQLNDVGEAAWAAWTTGGAATAAAAAASADSAARAADSAAVPPLAAVAAWAATYAASAAADAGWGFSRENFYGVWWTLVRLRLAIVDAATAELNPSNQE